MTWLLDAVEQAHEECPDELRGWAMGRGLQAALFDDMKIGCWVLPDSASGDEEFDRRNGPRGSWREGWMTVPYWSPRGDLLGLEFRTWGYEPKEVRDFRTPRSAICPTFIGMCPSSLQRVWEGGDVWLVEGVFDLSIAHAIPRNHVVFACGTARLTRSQLAFLTRFLSREATVHLMFDEDLTGRKQVEGFVDDSGKSIPGIRQRVEKAGLRCRDIRYRGGKDPGEIWERGGKAALLKATQLL